MRVTKEALTCQLNDHNKVENILFSLPLSMLQVLKEVVIITSRYNIARPSQRYLGQGARLSRTRTCELLQQLESYGLISMTRSFRKTSRYYINELLKTPTFKNLLARLINSGLYELPFSLLSTPTLLDLINKNNDHLNGGAWSTSDTLPVTPSPKVRKNRSFYTRRYFNGPELDGEALAWMMFATRKE